MPWEVGQTVQSLDDDEVGCIEQVQHQQCLIKIQFWRRDGLLIPVFPPNLLWIPERDLPMNWKPAQACTWLWDPVPLTRYERDHVL